MDTKKLRQKILDLAIHGKLVLQDPNDEPASVLLERIKAEKELLIKEGKIKPSKKTSKTSDTPHYENILPNGWCWSILGDIFQHNNGKQKTSLTQKGKLHRYITTSNVYWDKFDFSEVKEMRFIESEIEKYTAKKGDLLVCEGGDIGRAAIWNYDSPICIQNHLHRLRAYIPVCTKYFLFSLMNSKAKGGIKGKGIGLMSLSANDLHNIIICIATISRTISYCRRDTLINQIEQGKSDLQAIIKQTKNKILDLAIHGKLVPQDPNDEPASELLKRINPNAQITTDNGHSEKLPNGWGYCRLCDILKITMGQSPNGDSINKNKGIEFHQGKLCFSDKYLRSSNIFTAEPTKIADANSLLLCVRAPVGIVNITQNKICIGRGLCSLKPFKGDVDFYFYLLQTLQKRFENQATGTTFKAISGDIVKNEIISLPPLAEQQRIVHKIEELFSVLDNIQKALEA